MKFVYYCFFLVVLFPLSCSWPRVGITPAVCLQDDIMPADKKGEFLRSGGGELQRTLDFHVCSQSDAFVPAISGLFYGNVAGKRIPAGRNLILVPSQVQRSSTSAADFVSAYISEKNHLAYSCHC